MMRLINLAAILLLAPICLIMGNSNCHTTAGELCLFPFKILGDSSDMEYTGCVNINSTSELYWCPKVLNSQGYVDHNNISEYNVCSYFCPRRNYNNEEVNSMKLLGEEQMVVPGNCFTRDNQKCIIPFHYNGYRFDACTIYDAGSSKMPWCPTSAEQIEMSMESNMVTLNHFEVKNDTNWGECMNTCKVVDPQNHMITIGTI